MKKSRASNAPKAESSKPKTVEELLAEAKRAGLDDRRTAQYAGLTLAEFRQRLKDDPALQRHLRMQHAQGLGDHLQSIKESPQWQAQKYLLEKLWIAEFGPPKPKPRKSRENHPMYSSFKEVASRMTEDQIARAAELLELGRQADNQRKAAGRGGAVAAGANGAMEAACPPMTEIRSSVSPPAFSPKRTSPTPSEALADSSASPGMSSSRARRS